MLKKIAILLTVLGVVAWAENSKGVEIKFHSAFKTASIYELPPAADYTGSSTVTPVIGGKVTASPGDTVGTTTYDFQQNGAQGHRVMVDKDGHVHFDWMYSAQPYSSSYPDRAIYYNFWSGSFQLGKGVNGSGSWRSGYTTLGLMPDGRAVLGFHHHPAGAGDQVRSAVTVDAGEGLGLFGAPVDIDTTTVPTVRSESPIWPHIAVGPTGVIHAIAHPSTDTPPTGGSGWAKNQYYSRSTDGGATFSPWMLLTDSCSDDAAIATSKTSGKVGIACLFPTDPAAYPWNNVRLFESSDNGATWGGVQNITSYETPPVDTEHIYATAFHHDIDLVYDNNDKPHCTWVEIWSFKPNDSTWSYYLTFMTRIMHWSQATGVSVVSGKGLVRDTTGGIDTLKLWGVSPTLMLEWNYLQSQNMGIPFGACFRPELVVGKGDTLYCLFNGNKDTTDVSLNGYMNAEIYACYSPDGGKTWMSHRRNDSVIDITNSHSPNADAGYCDDDRNFTVAPYATNDGYLHVEYLNDKDAGSSVNTAGITTENPILYLKYPTSTFPGVEESGGPKPVSFALFSARPNPFSHATTISYQAGANEPVRFTIFDVSGRAVRNLFDANPTGGIRTVRWDGRDTQGKPVPEGVYFYTVKAGTAQATGKMLLVR